MGLSDLNMKLTTNLVSRSGICGAVSPLPDVWPHGMHKDGFIFTFLKPSSHFCYHTIRNFNLRQFVSISEFGTKTTLLLLNTGR
jgi:hypothetical protein